MLFMYTIYVHCQENIKFICTSIRKLEKQAFDKFF